MKQYRKIKGMEDEEEFLTKKKNTFLALKYTCYWVAFICVLVLCSRAMVLFNSFWLFLLVCLIGSVISYAIFELAFGRKADMYKGKMSKCEKEIKLARENVNRLVSMMSLYNILTDDVYEIRSIKFDAYYEALIIYYAKKGNLNDKVSRAVFDCKLGSKDFGGNDFVISRDSNIYYAAGAGEKDNV